MLQTPKTFLSYLLNKERLSSVTTAGRDERQKLSRKIKIFMFSWFGGEHAEWLSVCVCVCVCV